MQIVRSNVFIPQQTQKTVNAEAEKTVAASLPSTTSFGSLLEQRIVESDAQSLRFSKHAQMRLKSRDITLTNEQTRRALEGVSKAKAKGIRDSLVLVDEVALVVNTKTSTVITAMDGKNDSVFTNIDGAVIV